MNRRDFLQLLATASATAAVPSAFLIPRIARASTTPFDPATARYFVLIRVRGGWDVTLGLDPKSHSGGSTQDDMFIEYAPQAILDAGGVKLGPAAAPLMPYAGQFSVVNGLITASSDNGHDANMNYVSTGNGEGHAPFLPVEIAASSSSGPLGVVFSGQVVTLDRSVMISSMANVRSLSTSLRLAVFQDFINASGVRDDYFNGQQSMLQQSDRLEALIQRLAGLPAPGPSAARADAEVLSAAFASGCALQGQIDLNFLNLDTHSNHAGVHMTEQTKGWTEVAEIFNVFKTTPAGSGGASLFDRTVFMVISEFSRTPALNGARGKDHNPLTNSVLLSGGGIQGGLTVGESHLITKANSRTGQPIHTALPMDFTTHAVARTRAAAEAAGASFRYLTPEPLVATVADALRVDRQQFRSVPAGTPVIAGLAKAGW